MTELEMMDITFTELLLSPQVVIYLSAERGLVVGDEVALIEIDSLNETFTRTGEGDNRAC